MSKRHRVSPIFVSYAWEDPEYCKLVKRFAARLRKDGIDARLDAWHLRGVSIPEFMAREVRTASKIIVLCSPQYRTKVHAMEERKSINGSGWEAMLVTSALWACRREWDQIIPVLFRGAWQQAAPDFLCAFPYIDLTDPLQFEANYLRLRQTLANRCEVAPALGAPPKFENPVAVEPLRGTALSPQLTQPRVTLVSNAAIPRQLPPPPRDLVGRKSDIAKLINAVRQGGVTISGVRGVGGIGKTALALAVADALTADFPAGQIYLDLKGARHQGDAAGVPPFTTAEAMDHVIHSFDPFAKVSTNDAERDGLYRTILNSGRVLLLMDNALNEQQVERLVPPAGSVMIVTSREHFTLPGLCAHNLSELSTRDARQLLLSIAPAIGDYADEIAKICGYLPQALRAVASTLVNASNVSAADLVGRTSDVKHRLRITGVELSLETSSELLRVELRDHWFDLGVFPATFDESAAAAIWGAANDDAREILSSLVRSSLVEFDSAHGRYHLHDLVRDFAISRLDKSAAALARFRHSVHYLDILESADYLYRRGNAGVALGLGIFERRGPTSKLDRDGRRLMPAQAKMRREFACLIHM
jgi:hypothetical protein